MTRILLATEGATDQTAAIGIIKLICGSSAIIDAYKFPSRGIQVVRNALPTVARASYFGFYDALVIHFDLDSSVDISKIDDPDAIRHTERWQDMDSRIQKHLNSYHHIGRTTGVKPVFMAPCQSTDAWLTWGMKNGGGKQWECKHREELKHGLYGNPPLRMNEKTPLYVDRLVEYMQQDKENWPLSLRLFVSSLKGAVSQA